MKKHETLSRGEELLADVLEECLDEDLSFIPPEREIARTHRFSQKFEEAMNALLETGSGYHREQEIRRHFSLRYGHLAACVLVFCICGALFYQVAGPMFDNGAMEGTESAAVTEEAAPEEEKAESETGAGLEQVRIYCGQTVTLASQQEVPEVLDYVTTLVNCPVQDEENPILYLTIGNIGEDEIRYLNHYDLEVWMDGGWYIIPSSSEEQGEWLSLESGMAVDEEIDLTDYQIDYDAQQYRLITYVEQELISAEFTFEEVFAETMEKLEGETYGE